MKIASKKDIEKMKFEEIYGQWQARELSCDMAARVLGMSVRTFFRKRERYEEEGVEWIYDRRYGRGSNNRATDEEIEKVTKMYEDKYRGFSVRHFYDYYKKEDAKPRSYNWCRTVLHTKGLIRKSKRGGPHRLRRERKPMEGMMVHQDASTHEWLIGLGYNLDLIVTMDDATSEITSCFLTEQEGTESSMRGIKETIENKGLFCQLYTDRGSHYAYTPQAGGKVDKSKPTQVGRALKELGIQHIHAYSPQARGRSERMFGTLQGRLPKDLQLAGITTMEEANKYLKEVYIPEHNTRFAKKAADTRSAYLPWAQTSSLDEYLCSKEKRTVQKDNTVQYGNKKLQIPAQEHRHHYVKADVEVRAYIDGSLGIFYGHLCLGRYDEAGDVVVKKKKTSSSSSTSSSPSLDVGYASILPHGNCTHTPSTIGQLAC